MAPVQARRHRLDPTSDQAVPRASCLTITSCWWSPARVAPVCAAAHTASPTVLAQRASAPLAQRQSVSLTRSCAGVRVPRGARWRKLKWSKRQVVILEVAGSSPVRHPKRRLSNWLARVVVAHVPSGPAGSSPARRTQGPVPERLGRRLQPGDHVGSTPTGASTLNCPVAQVEAAAACSPSGRRSTPAEPTPPQ